MKRKIITTADGSTTIHLEDWQEQYHSRHGAIQEAYHVFLKNGLYTLNSKEISILEMGFGTGLNALITLIEAEKKGLKIHYTGIERYPISDKELKGLNFVEALDASAFHDIYTKMHSVPWDQEVAITELFVLEKKFKDFRDVKEANRYSLIYFDAFGARVQPELWTEDIFNAMFAALKKGGILVTYSAKGSVRRAMEGAGFTTERLPGPPGKREMLRATKGI